MGEDVVGNSRCHREGCWGEAVSRFRQRDLTRALKGTVEAGLQVARLEIEPMTGKIVIQLNCNQRAEPTEALDRWRASNACKA